MGKKNEIFTTASLEGGGDTGGLTLLLEAVLKPSPKTQPEGPSSAAVVSKYLA